VGFTFYFKTSLTSQLNCMFSSIQACTLDINFRAQFYPHYGKSHFNNVFTLFPPHFQHVFFFMFVSISVLISRLIFRFSTIFPIKQNVLVYSTLRLAYQISPAILPALSNMAALYNVFTLFQSHPLHVILIFLIRFLCGFPT